MCGLFTYNSDFIVVLLKLNFMVTIFFLQSLKHNGSLYAHVFFAQSGYSPDPSDPEYQPQAAFGRTHRMFITC